MANTTTAAQAIGLKLQPGAIEALFRNDQLLSVLRANGLVEPPASSIFGTAYQWNVHSTGNSSAEQFTEYASAPAAGAQGIVRASLAYAYFWGWIEITGHLRDALKAGAYLPEIPYESERIAYDIAHARNTVYMGTGTNGIQNAIAATGTYAGIARGSATYWESYVDATSAAQSVAAHRTAWRTMTDSAYGGKLTLNLTSPTQASTYAGLVGVAGGTTPAIRYNVDNGAVPSGLDVGFTNLSLFGAPVATVAAFTSSVWLYLDMSQGQMVHAVTRPFEVMFHSNVGDNELYKASTGGALLHLNPVKCAKRTGLT